MVVVGFDFLTAILDRGLRNDFFFQPIYFSQFLFGLLFPFRFVLNSFQIRFKFVSNSFLFNRGHILDFFQIFLQCDIQNVNWFLGHFSPPTYPKIGQY